MVDFAVHGLPLKNLGVKVVGASVDSVESTATLRSGLHVGFPMVGELDAHAVAESTGAMIQTGDKTFLHATGFLLAPDRTVAISCYSSGPIGRFTASEVIRKVLFEQQKS